MSIFDWFRLDGIQDDELPPNSDWYYLTPLERLGVQSREDAQIARRVINERRRAVKGE